MEMTITGFSTIGCLYIHCIAKLQFGSLKDILKRTKYKARVDVTFTLLAPIGRKVRRNSLQLSS